MAIVQTASGVGTVNITYDPNTSLSDVITVINVWLTGHGWELHYTNNTNVYVYKTLDEGGTAGISTHYSYVEFDYSTVNRVILRQWLSWSGGVGVSKAQNSYVNTANSSTNNITISEDAGAQAISVASGLNTGGTILLIAHPGTIYLLATTPERTGNLSFKSKGTLITRRVRVHSSDVLGVVPQCCYLHTSAIESSVFTSAGFSYRWSLPIGIDGGNNTSSYAGKDAGFFIPFSMELSASVQNLDITTNVYVNTIDAFSGDRYAGNIYLRRGGTGTVQQSLVGILHNVVRPLGTMSTGATLTCTCDSSGILDASGASRQFRIVDGSFGVLS